MWRHRKAPASFVVLLAFTYEISAARVYIYCTCSGPGSGSLARRLILQVMSPKPSLVKDPSTTDMTADKELDMMLREHELKLEKSRAENQVQSQQFHQAMQSSQWQSSASPSLLR